MKVNGIPNKRQAAVLAAFAVYAVVFIVFLCVNAEKIDDISTRRILALAGLVPGVALYALVLRPLALAPKARAAKIVEEHPLWEELGYKYDNFSYDKKRGILEVRYENADFPPLVLVLDEKADRLTPCLSNGGELFNIWELLEILDEEIYQSVDELNECLELLVGYMKDNSDSFAEDFADCRKLFIRKIPDTSDRPTAYHLNCYDGACLIDVGNAVGQFHLERISFDGFGTFHIGNIHELLTLEESRRFELEMRRQNPSQKVLRPLVRKLVRLNRSDIDAEVFARYPLLKTWSEEGDKAAQNPRKRANAANAANDANVRLKMLAAKANAL